jgi:hypothetical protein
MRGLTRRELFAAAAGVTVAGAAVSCAADKKRLTEPPQSALDDLAGRLRGVLMRPGDPQFRSLVVPRNLRFGATMPEAVVLCTDAHDVAEAVSWARKTNTPLAIRGGGHNYADASSSRGIIIATRNMGSAKVNGASLTAQAGVRNADLAELLPKGRMLLPGGNCPGVGVAGLTLGGGIGPNAPWAGLTADRLRKVTMVTAAGDMVTASGTENPDLFWALRGGAGGNFGVVTDLEYEMVEAPVGKVTNAELTVTGHDAAVAVAVGFQQLRAEAERTVTGNLYLGHAKHDVEAILTLQVLGDERTARELLSPLLAIVGMKSDIVQRDWWDAYRWYITPPSPPYSFWDRSLYADDFLTGDAISAALDIVRRFPADDSDPERYGAMGIYGWVGGKVGEVASDATAYVHRKARILIEMSSGWSTPKDSSLPANPIPPEIKQWEESLWENLLPHTTGRSYQNFPDPGLTDWGAAYYGDNLAKLERLKAIWDPGRVFTYSQAIPPSH